MGGGGRKSPTGADAFENPISSFEQEKDGGSPVVGRTAASVEGDGAVLPESLDAQEGSQQCEIWKESLVEHVGDFKENARDRTRRKAQERLKDSRILDPDGGFRRQWDLAQMLLLVYVAFVVPYRLGFSHPVLLW